MPPGERFADGLTRPSPECTTAAPGGTATMNHWFNQLFNESISIRGHSITYREIVGNLFGLASALGGLRRRVWAWPVGIVGNVLLFTVFLGVAFGTPGSANLYG